MFICISRPSAQNVSSTRPRVIRNQLTEDDNEVLPLLPHQGNATQTEGNHCVIYVIIVFHFLKLLLNLQIHLCNLNLVLLVVLRVRLRVRRTQNPGFGNMCDVTLIDKKYKCSYCEKSYVKNGTGVIQRHLRNKHNEKLKNMKSQQCTLTSTLHIKHQTRISS